MSDNKEYVSRSEELGNIHISEEVLAAIAAAAALEEIIAREEPVFRRRGSHFDMAEECLKSRGARVFRCPGCENWLCNGNWYRLEDRYVARSRCVEHGRFYSCLTIRPDGAGQLQGELRVYGEEQFSQELFKQCKLGGERIEVCKMPRKRRRIRKGKSKVNVESGAKS